MNITEHFYQAVRTIFPGDRRRPGLLAHQAVCSLSVWALVLIGSAGALTPKISAAQSTPAMYCKPSMYVEHSMTAAFPSTLLIPPGTVPVGHIIATTTVSGSRTFSGTCIEAYTGNTSLAPLVIIELANPSNAVKSGDIYVYRVPGTNIGIRFRNVTNWSTGYGGRGPAALNTPLTKNFPVTVGQSFSNSVGGSVTIDLITLGPVQAGDTIPPMIFAYVRPADISMQPMPMAFTHFPMFRLEISTQSVLAPHTCKVSSPTVNMGSHHFTGDTVGAASPSVDFSVHLTDCPIGVPIRYRNTPSKPAPSPYHMTALALDSSSTAAGVGIRIRKAENDANLLNNSSVEVTPGSYAANHEIKLRAQYLQIAPTVTPGTANSSSTITLDYP